MEGLHIPDEVLEHATEEELARLIALLERAPHVWSPTERQIRANELAERCDETFYGGAVGGGKTALVLMRAWELANRYDGYRALILRRTFPEVRKSLIPPSLRMYDHRIARFLAGEYVWRIANGSSIEFGHMEQENDWVKYQGGEWDFIAFDELTHFTFEHYVEVMQRCRTTVKRIRQGVRPHMMATSNPGGIGHDWVKQRFIDPAPPETVFRRRNHTLCYVPAKIADNPHLDPEYIHQLDQLSPRRRRALAEGDWDAYEGQFFSEWDRELHVCKPFKIPPHWPRARGIDYGYANPYCCVWVAFGPDGEAYVYREAMGTLQLPSQQAAHIKAQSRYGTEVPGGFDEGPERYMLTVADPSIWVNTGIGQPISAQYVAAGLVTNKALNAREAGWAKVREYLHVDEGRRTRMHIFETCRYLIRTIPAAPTDERNPEDLDTDCDDHGLDALRYVLATKDRYAKNKRHYDPPPDSVDAVLARDDKARRRHRTDVHPVAGKL